MLLKSFIGKLFKKNSKSFKISSGLKVLTCVVIGDREILIKLNSNYVVISLFNNQKVWTNYYHCFGKQLTEFNIKWKVPQLEQLFVHQAALSLI